MSSSANKFEEVVEIFYYNFTSKQLESMLKHFCDFVKKYKDLCVKEGINERILDWTNNANLSKVKLANIAAIPFYNNILYRQFLTILPTEIVLVLEESIWTSTLSNRVLIDRFRITAFNKFEYNGKWKPQIYYELKDSFSLFHFLESNSDSNNAAAVLYLDNSLRKLLKTYYDVESKKDFKPVQEKDINTQHIFLGEDNALSDLSKALIYDAQGKIKLSKITARPLASTLSKMKRTLKINEFFPKSKEKLLVNLKTMLLANHIQEIPLNDRKQHETEFDREAFFRQLFRNELKSVFTIFHYLPGLSNMFYRNWESGASVNLHDIIKKMPVEKWISHKNIEDYLKYNVITIRPVDLDMASSELYFKFTNSTHNWTNKYFISPDNYKQAIETAFIKGSFFYYATLGLFDIAYDEPDVSELGSTAYSPYDSLQYVRLNKFGAYILGLEEAYKMPYSFKNISHNFIRR